MRWPGDILHPDREREAALAALKHEIGSLRFSAQYQQRPIPLEGNLIKRMWFRSFNPAELPARTGMTKVVQSWDVASRTGDSNDYSVCTTWRLEKDDVYLLHVFRARLEYPDLRRKVGELAKVFCATTILIEDAGPGVGLLDDLKTSPPPGLNRPIGVKPEGGKSERMESQTAKIEAGHVRLCVDAPWLEDFLFELLAFPYGRHDDQVDSVSQFLTWWQRDRFRFAVPIVMPYVFCDRDIFRGKRRRARALFSLVSIGESGVSSQLSTRWRRTRRGRRRRDSWGRCRWRGWSSSRVAIAPPMIPAPTTPTDCSAEPVTALSPLAHAFHRLQQAGVAPLARLQRGLHRPTA